MFVLVARHIVSYRIVQYTNQWEVYANKARQSEARSSKATRITSRLGVEARMRRESRIGLVLEVFPSSFGRSAYGSVGQSLLLGVMLLEWTGTCVVDGMDLGSRVNALVESPLGRVRSVRAEENRRFCELAFGFFLGLKVDLSC